MAEKIVCFRKYIPWEKIGLVWEDDFFIPSELILFLYQSKEISEKDKLGLLRIYSLLQFGDPDCDNDIEGVLENLTSKKTSDPAFVLPAWIDKDEDGYSLMPLYEQIYPDLGEAGYDYFIQGRVYSFVFPNEFLDILKKMPLVDKDGNPKNKTANFVLSFVYQITINGGMKFIKDDYYCGSQQLSSNYEALLYAIAKTCYEGNHTWNVHSNGDSLKISVKNGQVIADILQDGITATFSGEADELDEATQMFFLNKYGEENSKRIKKETFEEWRKYWENIIGECGITRAELLTMLRRVFENNDHRYIPDPYMKPSKKNPVATTLAGLVLMEKSRTKKKKQTNNQQYIMSLEL